MALDKTKAKNILNSEKADDKTSALSTSSSTSKLDKNKAKELLTSSSSKKDTDTKTKQNTASKPSNKAENATLDLGNANNKASTLPIIQTQPKGNSTVDENSIETTSEKQNIFQRIWNTIKGAEKQEGASFGEALTTMYGTGQKSRTSMYEQQAEDAKYLLDRAVRDYNNAIADGADAEEIEIDRQNVEKYQAQYDAYRKVLDEQIQEKATSESHNVVADLNESGQRDIEKAEEGLGAFGKMLVEGGASAVQSGTDALISAAMGMPQNMLPFAIRAFGSSAIESRANGDTEGQIIAKGLIGAAKEVATEKMSNMTFLGKAAYGKGTLDGVIEKGVGLAVNKLAKTAGGQDAIEFVLTKAASMLGEGAEEFVGDWLEYGIAKLDQLVGTGLYDDNDDTLAEVFANSLYDFAVGTVSGAIGDVASVGNLAGTKITGNATNKVGTDALIKATNESYEGSDAKKYAERYSGLEKLSDMQAGRLAQSYRESINEGINVDSLLNAAYKGVKNNDLNMVDNVIDNEQALSVLADESGLNLTEDMTKNQVRAAVANALNSATEDTGFNVRNAEYKANENQTANDRYVASLLRNDDDNNTADSDTASEAFANESQQKNTSSQANTQTSRITPETDDFSPQAQAEKNTEDVASYATMLDSNGSKVIKSSYDASISPKAFISEFTQYYNAGLTGNSNYVKNVSRFLTAQQREAAFKAGIADRVVASKKAESNSKAAGFDYSSNKDYDESKAKVLDKLGKKLGIRIKFGNASVGENGSYDVSTKTLTVSKDANAVLTVVKHEITHRMQDLAPKQYQEYKDYVTEYYRQNGKLEYLINKYLDAYRDINQEFSRNEALDEIVADFTANLFMEDAAFEELVNTNRTLAQKIHDILVDIINALRGIVGREQIQELNEFEKKWRNLLEAATKESAKLDMGISYDSIQSETMRYSLKSMEIDIEEGKMKADLIKQGIFTEAEADAFFDNVNRLMGLISKKAFLDLNEAYSKNDRPFKAWKKNSDVLYKMSLDYSTLCKKRLVTGLIIDRLNEKQGKSLSATTQYAIRQKLSDLQSDYKKLEIACAMCYVETARLKAPEQINKFLDNKKSIAIDYFAKKDSAFKKACDAKAKKKYGVSQDVGMQSIQKIYGKEIHDNVYAETRRLRQNYKLSDYQKSVVDKIENTDNTKFLSAAGLTTLASKDPVVYDIYYSYVRNSTKSKAIETDVPYYYGDSKGRGAVSNKLIKQLNQVCGMRSQSWSDFQLFHLLDNITAICEMSVRHSKMHAFTKVKDFVYVNGATGMMINMSLIPAGQTGFDSKGNLKFSPVEGMDIKDVVEGREAFPETAGSIAIGISDEHIIALLNDDRIDMVIPYHKSAISEDVARIAGINEWTDYSDAQNSLDMETGRAGDGPDFSLWLDLSLYDLSKPGIEVMQDMADKYKEECYKMGVTPVFEKFANEDNYWKLIIGRKMIDQSTGKIIVQQEVKPNFDWNKLFDIVKKAQDPKTDQMVEELTDIISAAIKSGEIDAIREHRASNEFAELTKQVLREEGFKSEILKDSDAFLAKNVGHSLKDSDGKSLSAAQQEYFKNSKVLDENGNLRVVYHGTNEQFTVFDRTKTRANMDIQGNFFTPFEEDAQGYGDNVGAYYLNITNPASESVAYSALNKFKGQNNAGVKAREYLISKGYDGVYNGYDEYISFYPEQTKRVDNVNPTLNKDVRYSLNDSNGNPLSEAQKEYFKDSQVTDQDGNLKLVYHGSPAMEIESFDKSKGGSHAGVYKDKQLIWFTDSEKFADDFSYEFKPGNDQFTYKRGSKGKVYGGYLNITNPFDLTNPTSEILNCLYEKMGKKNVDEALKYGNHQLIKFDLDYAELAEMGYDGIIAKLDVKSDNLEYGVFNSNQFKSADNKNPSNDQRIKYSLKDNEGNSLSKAQQKFFKNSKVRDDDGRLRVMYHGTTQFGFTVFDTSQAKNVSNMGSHFGTEYAGKVFSNVNQVLEDRENGGIYKVYLNITNPFETYDWFAQDDTYPVLVAQELAEEIDTDEAYELLDVIRNLDPLCAELLDGVVEPDGDTWIGKGRDDSPERIKLYDTIRSLLELGGYDGLTYQNDLEDEGAWDFIALYPEQIKDIDNKNPTKNVDIRYSLMDQEELSDANLRYSLRTEDPPKKTGIAYKVFLLKDGKLYPPMVANPGGKDTPVGVWLNADIGQSAAPSKTGRLQVQAGGKGTATSKSSLAFRPGWHLGEIPLATQFGRFNPETGEKDLFPSDFVWAECEYAMDKDYQEEAMSYGYTAKGKFRHAYAGLPAVPKDGYYKYRTNPNPDTVPWIITGAIKVNRILSNEEVAKICRDNGVEPMQIKGSRVRYSLDTERSEAVEKNLAKKSKKYNALADKRDSGEKLTYEEFKSFYHAHKILAGKTEAEKLDIINSIKENGFKSGAHSLVNVNVMSANNDNSNAALLMYRPSEGEYVLLVPDFWTYNNFKKGEDYILEGYKPLPYEVVKVEYNSQPYYELYDKAYNEYFNNGAEPYIVNKYKGYSYEELDKLRIEYGDKAIEYSYGDNPDSAKADEYWNKRNEVAEHMRRYFNKDGVRYSLNAFEHLKGWNESDENQISFDEIISQMQSEKLTGDKAFIIAMQETVDNIADNHFSEKYLREMFKEYPEMNFMRRFKAQDPSTKADLEAFLSKIDDITLLQRISWMVPQLYTYGTRGTYNGVATKFRKIVNARIQELGAEKQIGRDLGLQEGYATFEDIEKLFYKLNQNKETEALAKKVFNTAKDLGLQIRFENALLGHSKSSGVSSGRYVQYKLNIFNSTTVTDQRKADVILHEVIHSCTSYALWNYERGGYSLSGDMHMACETLESVYREIRHDPNFAGQYGLKDVYEMVAELANADFREKLQKKNLLQTVIDSILRMFGVIRSDVKTAYDVASETLYWLLDNVDMYVYDDYSRRVQRDLSRAGKKFSLQSAADYQKEINALERQNESLKKTSARLSNEITANTKITDTDAKRLADTLLTEYPASMSKKDLTAKILEIYRAYANAKDPEQAYVEIKKSVSELADKLAKESGVITNPNYELYGELRNYLRDKLKGDKKRMDSLYEDLMETYPEFFSTENITAEDAYIEIKDVYENLKDKMIENPFKGDEEMVSEYAANEILALLFDSQIETFAGKMNSKIEAGKKSKAEALLKQRKADQERMNKLIQQNRIKRKELIGKMNEKSTEKIQKLMDQYKAKTEEGKVKQSRKVLREKILRHSKSLSDKLLKATDKKHIPQELQGITATLLSYLNLESNYATDFETGKRVKNVNLNDPNKAYAITKRTAAAQQLRSAYEDFLRDTGFSEDDFDVDLIDNLRSIEKMGDTPIGLLNVEQLETIWKTMRSLEAMISNYNKVLVQSKLAQVTDFAFALRRDNQGKSRSSVNGAAGKLDKLINIDSLTPQAYFHRLGEAGEEIFRLMRKAQDNHITLMNEFKSDVEKIVEGLDISKLERESHEFNLGGRKFEMSTAQIMALYETMKRPQAWDHVYTGGIRPRVIQKGLKKESTAEPIHLLPGDIAKITDTLTENQKAIADKLQGFMASKPAAAGNVASMLVYGYEKFGEKTYYPLDVDRNEVRSELDKGEGIQTTIASMGSAKALTQHANNAIFINSIFDDVAQNSNDMAKYSAWLATMDTINKIRNYKFKDVAETRTVSTILENVFGVGGKKYWRDLLNDINNSSGGDLAFSEGMVGKMKAASIAGNIRVIVQQPTAIIRAYAVMDPKYLNKGIVTKGDWEKIKKYAPIAIWKDWGYFDINTGRSMKNILFNTDTKMEKIVEKTMELASLADSMTWSRIWNACEYEIADTTDLKRGTDEFYQAVANRFNEVIDKTQVVDGVLQRSQIMRSKNTLDKWATSFMSEPTKTLNMILSAEYDYHNAKTKDEKSKAKQAIARTVFAIGTSLVVNAIAQSLVDAMRDDDDEEYWRKLLEAFCGYEGNETSFKTVWESNLGDAFDPISYIPYLKDIKSLIQGYSVERMDMSALSDAVNAVTKLIKAISGEGKKTIAATSAEFFLQASKLLGLPIYNIKRDVIAIFNTIVQIVDDPSLTRKVKNIKQEFNFR